ncbi:thiol reductant ABC exporter subunit CydD [Nocardioides sp. TRM66260-LWL]|uniref:thiol reductant ABC exporter subunit CydD n=1 Tax=Nocardioides sp. TRM66260-LWL TaxID=2874478 RepID=UPI001CC4415E|nr:thiol reductant ABC exporter subunit CydD [Nocardioides sp. TRM66260-LWL]MBZ5735779.1 thiol reductant ABC exporter subunit CydD [Nocardioides sp. TRM66260-LWL]
MRPLDPRLLPHLAPARRPLAVVGLAGVLSAGLVVAQAWSVTGLVLAVLPTPLGRTTAGLGAGGWAAAVAVVLLLRGVVGRVGDEAAARAAGRVGVALRERLARVVLARPAPDAARDSVLLTRGVAAAEPYLTRYLPALVLGVVLPPLTVVAIALEDLTTALIVLATLPLVPVFGALVGLATRDRAARQWRSLGRLSGHFLDVVRGLPTLVAHRRAAAQTRRIAALTDAYRRASLATLRVAFASSAVLELVATLSVALVAVTVGVRLADGGLDLHTALLVLLLAPEAYWPLRRVGAEFHAAAEGVATFEAAEALLAGAAGTTGAVGAIPGRGEAPVDASPAALVLDDLTVAFPGRRVPALPPTSAVVPSRGLTVLTGPSGCGKSTLLGALAGEPGAGAEVGGTVLLGGRPLEPAGEAWRRQVAVLPQRPVLLADTVAANLRLAAPDASDRRLWDALERVALAERVRDLGGLAASVAEDGRGLSAGERARLALARLVLGVEVGGRRWVLLDEPTAHLDEITERLVLDTVVELARDVAVLAVAHQDALVALADHRIALAPPADPGPAATAVRPPVRDVEPAADPASPGTAADDEPESERRLLRRLRVDALIGALASGCGVALTATAGWLIVQAASRPPVLTLLVAIVAVRAFGLGRPALRYLARLRSHDAALRLLARRRVEAYAALVPLVPARLGAGGTRGEVLAGIVDDVDGVVDRELRVRMPVREAVVVGLGTTLVALLLLPAAGVVVGCGALAGGCGAWLLARRSVRRAEPDLVAARARLSGVVVEALGTAAELRAWQATGRAVGAIAGRAAEVADAGRRAARGPAAARLWLLATAGATIAATAVVAEPAVSTGSLGGPVLALLVLLPLALLDLLLPLADAGALAVRVEAAAARLDAWERTAPAVRDTVASARLHPGVRPGLALQGATTRWTPGAPLVGPVDLVVSPGERVALLGPSGCGKSTVAALALRFLDPVAGSVRLDDVDLRTLPLDDVRARVGLVDDEPHVFATSVLENVRLARPTASRAEVVAALRAACLGEWLDALPQGADTLVGAGHAAVSGGERARLGVARALLADAAVLVLDEPAAHLDHPTALRLAGEVLGRGVAGGRTVLWITHTPIGLELVDRVVRWGPAGVGQPVPRVGR